MSFNLTTSLAIIRKAGANLNATAAASGALISQFCDEAEGVVCAYSGVDYITTRPTSSFGLALLSDTVATIAAINLVTYSINDYFSKAEAQTTLNVLSDNAQRNLTLLKNSDVRSKM